MELYKCSRCGAFHTNPGDVCSKCANTDNLELSTFNSYIQQNGFTSIDIRKVKKYVNDNDLEENVVMYPGADEIGLTLISRCLNDYESGSWEALEAMKEEVSFQPLIRIIESLQTAVEKVPIKEAFDELDSDREYYQDKRKEANDRLISKKGMIGRAIGFTPLIGIFVGYLVVPLVLIGLTSMTSSFETMQAM